MTEEQRDIRSQARALADKELRPYAARWDDKEEFPERSYRQLVDAGLIGLTVPVEHGGRGMDLLTAVVLLEEVARGCLSSAMALQMNLNGPPRAIMALGTEEQQKTFLPGAADGSRYFAIAMTEPQAGSDGLALETNLRKTEEGYKLAGEKCYITGGERADTYLVFCRLRGTVGPYGIGAAIVERDMLGFAPPEVHPKMGSRGVGEAALRFHDVVVPKSHILIEPQAESKAGAELLLKQFNPERCGNAAMSIGVAVAAFEDSLLFAKERKQFGRPIIEFQGLRWKLADMSVDIDAARLLTWRAAQSDDGGFPDLRQTLTAKLYANEMVQRVTNEAIALHGHLGYARVKPIERYFRDGRGLAIGGGTPEIARNIIAGEITGYRVSQRG